MRGRGRGRRKGVALPASVAVHSLKSFCDEKEAVEEARRVKDKYTGSRLLDDAMLDKREVELSGDEKIMMDKIFAQKQASEDNQMSSLSSTLKTTPSTAGRHGGVKDEMDDEQYKELVKKLSPTMQKYVMDCDNALQSLDKACRENPNASVKAIIQHRADERQLLEGKHNPSDKEVEEATEHFQKLSLEAGGRKRAWQTELKRIRAAYHKKHRKHLPEELEQQYFFVWEQTREAAEARLPSDLVAVQIIARNTKQSGASGLLPKKMMDRIFQGAKPQLEPVKQTVQQPGPFDEVKRPKFIDAIPIVPLPMPAIPSNSIVNNSLLGIYTTQPTSFIPPPLPSQPPYQPPIPPPISKPLLQSANPKSFLQSANESLVFETVPPPSISMPALEPAPIAKLEQKMEWIEQKEVIDLTTANPIRRLKLDPHRQALVGGNDAATFIADVKKPRTRRHRSQRPQSSTAGAILAHLHNPSHVPPPFHFDNNKG